jgi:hypothetical protein
MDRPETRVPDRMKMLKGRNYSTEGSYRHPERRCKNRMVPKLGSMADAEIAILKAGRSDEAYEIF